MNSIYKHITKRTQLTIEFPPIHLPQLGCDPGDQQAAAPTAQATKVISSPRPAAVTRPLAFGGGTTCRPLVNPRGKVVVNPFNQPRSCRFSRREHDIVLEDVIQIDEPTPAAIENGDRPTAVGS